MPRVPMSQVATSTVQLKEAVMVHSPIKLERSGELNALRPGRVSPEAHTQHRDPHYAGSPTVMTAGQPAPRHDASPETTELRINTSTRAANYGEDQLCMCTPAQHVPRPCNSFILYRTRMAAKTIAENPGLSNPQISKILGDRWAKESAEVKSQWKKLAEEESKRHRLQYPGYRFQPKRRGSKAAQNKSPDEESERCSRCNGLKVLRTPVATPRAQGQPPVEATAPQSNGDYAHYQSPSPLGANSYGERGFSRRRDGPEEAQSLSPEPKRRRLTSVSDSPMAGHVQTWTHDPDCSSYGSTAPSPARRDSKGRGYGHAGMSLPHPGVMARPHHSSMPPPPRPPLGGVWSSPGHRFHAGHEAGHESVRLPPIKTAMTPAASPAQDVDTRFGFTPISAGLGMRGGRSKSPERSPEEQIMSISFTRKMAVVGKICPPLPHAAESRRGAIIAVEGSRDDILSQVSQAVEKATLVCPTAAPRSWSNDSNFAGAPKIGSTCNELQDLMSSIFEDILGWHRKSKEIIAHVQGEESDASSETVGDAGDVSPGQSAKSAKTPVALVKDGFSLTMSDKFACGTSHSLNNYGPVDHWQWMATLWRGIVGPDLVVYVKDCPEEDMEKLKTVEFQKQLGVMVVWVPAGKSLSEATERRLNFEVMEWITDVWPKWALRN